MAGMNARIALRAALVHLDEGRTAGRFQSGSEDRPFTLAVDEDCIRSLAGYLDSELDIEAVVSRDEGGTIVDGTLIGFSPVIPGDTGAVWRAWHSSHASDWDEIEDVERELGRGQD